MAVDLPPGTATGVYQWEGRPTWYAFREVLIVNRTGQLLEGELYQRPNGVVEVRISPPGYEEPVTPPGPPAP